MISLGLACLLTLAPPTTEGSASVSTSNASAASGSIDKGDVRLGLNGGLFSYTILTSSDEVAGVETRSSVHQWGLGFTGLGAPTAGGTAMFGWTAGYAITPNIEVGGNLSLAFGGGRFTNEVGDMSTEAQFDRSFTTWIQPYFHYNMQVAKPLVLVFEASVGFLYGHANSPPDAMVEARQRTLAPTFGPGVGLNFFLTKNASIDLMFNYNFGLLSEQSVVDTTTADADINAHLIMFRLGTSIWMGGNNK